MKTTVYICAEWNKYSKDFEYCNRSYLPMEKIVLEIRELDFDTPDEIAMKAMAVRVLQEKRNKIIADAHVEATAIDQEIQEMLALEDKSSVSEGNKTGTVVEPDSIDNDIPF